jgi:DNA-binding YbaB/EbfC family protein
MSFDMNKLMQQAQQMQQQMQAAQDELAKEVVEGSAGGGMVTVKASGNGEIVEVKISPEAIDPDEPAMLEDLVLAACNGALRSAQQLMESRLGSITGGLGGLGLPGL